MEASIIGADGLDWEREREREWEQVGGKAQGREQHAMLLPSPWDVKEGEETEEEEEEGAQVALGGKHDRSPSPSLALALTLVPPSNLRQPSASASTSASLLQLHLPSPPPPPPLPPPQYQHHLNSSSSTTTATTTTTTTSTSPTSFYPPYLAAAAAATAWSHHVHVGQSSSSAAISTAISIAAFGPPAGRSSSPPPTPPSSHGPPSARSQSRCSVTTSTTKAADAVSSKLPPVASRSPTMPGQVACMPCRERHLKCDGSKPACRRCLAEGSKCHYAPSRRGQRRRPLRPTRSIHPDEAVMSSQPSTPLPLVPTTSGPPTLATSNSVGASSSNGQTPRPPVSWPVNPRVDNIPPPAPPPPPPPSTTTAAPRKVSFSEPGHEAALTDLYYANFHHCHPFLIPKFAYYTTELPDCLRAVVRFIGGVISPFALHEPYKHAAAAALKNDGTWSPFRVQALLLFSIALHATNEEDEAAAMLSSAVDVAIMLGMNRYAFAAEHAQGQPVLDESFRRTWWELFTVDGMMAALDQRSWFRCNTVELEAALPCEDPEFPSASWLPKAPTLAQFDNRLFDDDEEVSYSSYCYRIEAVRLLSRVLAIAEDANVEKDSFTEVDNALAGWKYHLPPCKADIAQTTNGGEVDELMIQAHLIIYNATIMLHLPRSNLQTIHPLTKPTTCCPWSRPLAPTFTSQNHLMKVTAASQGLSDLAALRSAHEHTPLLACGLILGALVQLSICSLHASHCITQHRERVMLMIGVLKQLGRVWPLAKRGLVQVRIYAKEVLQRPVGSDDCTPTTRESIAEPAEPTETADIDFAPIDISWIDELAQQQPQTIQSQQHLPPPMPTAAMPPMGPSPHASLGYDSFTFYEETPFK